MSTQERRQAIKFGKLVKKKLIDMGMSQAELAEQLKMSRIYLCRILSGDRAGQKYKDKIMEFLNLNDAA